MFLTQTYKTANFISIIFILFLIANLVQSVTLERKETFYRPMTLIVFKGTISLRDSRFS